LILSGQIISPIALVDIPQNYIELQIAQPIVQATMAQTSTPVTHLEENESATTQTQPRRRRRTKLEMIAARALETELRANRE